MKTSELQQYHESLAATYDVLREVFFNSWKSEELPSLLSKIDLMSEEFKTTQFATSVKDLKEDLLDEARWEYNRLFIGPQKPLASTFESVHRSDKELMMREHTFQVRQFYKQVGLKVENENQFPDDFIGFEFQYLFYVCRLTVELIKNNEEDKALELVEIRKEFLEEHPKQWFPKFCEDICCNSKEQIWKDLASFISGVLDHDEAFLASFKQ